MRLNWKTARWIAIITAALSALTLLGISKSILGIGLEDELAGFNIKFILGLANILSVYILYKIL